MKKSSTLTVALSPKYLNLAIDQTQITQSFFAALPTIHLKIHIVWSRNGQLEGCSGMPHYIITLMILKSSTDKLLH